MLCWLAFPLASALGSTGSAASCPALFVGFPAVESGEVERTPCLCPLAQTARAVFPQAAFLCGRHCGVEDGLRSSSANRRLQGILDAGAGSFAERTYPHFRHLLTRSSSPDAATQYGAFPLRLVFWIQPASPLDGGDPDLRQRQFQPLLPGGRARR